MVLKRDRDEAVGRKYCHRGQNDFPVAKMDGLLAHFCVAQVEAISGLSTRFLILVQKIGAKQTSSCDRTADSARLITEQAARTSS